MKEEKINIDEVLKFIDNYCNLYYKNEFMQTFFVNPQHFLLLIKEKGLKNEDI